jgi:hypothetical protein
VHPFSGRRASCEFASGSPMGFVANVGSAQHFGIKTNEAVCGFG